MIPCNLRRNIVFDSSGCIQTLIYTSCTRLIGGGPQVGLHVIPLRSRLLHTRTHTPFTFDCLFGCCWENISPRENNAGLRSYTFCGTLLLGALLVNVYAWRNAVRTNSCAGWFSGVTLFPGTVPGWLICLIYRCRLFTVFMVTFGLYTACGYHLLCRLVGLPLWNSVITVVALPVTGTGDMNVDCYVGCLIRCHTRLPVGVTLCRERCRGAFNCDFAIPW